MSDPIQIYPSADGQVPFDIRLEQVLDEKAITEDCSVVWQ